MNSEFQFDQGSHGQVFVRGMVEDRASSRRSKHEGESSQALCDRLSRTRDFSQRQLPTDQDYAVSTREYQTDQSSQLPAPAAAGPVLEQRQKQRQRQKPPHQCAEVDGSLHIRACYELSRADACQCSSAISTCRWIVCGCATPHLVSAASSQRRVLVTTGLSILAESILPSAVLTMIVMSKVSLPTPA